MIPAVRDENFLDDNFFSFRQSVDQILERLIPQSQDLAPDFDEAIRYACLGEGKRFRSCLHMAVGEMFGVSRYSLLRVAAAIEMIHAYSLVHDDLPAMDNADLRRGKPSVHKAFGEATAILVGDALLTHAFDILVGDETHHDATIRCKLVSLFVAASGAKGMIAGQFLDLNANDGADLTELDLVTIARLKTAEMIALSVESAALLANQSAIQIQKLRAFGQDIGVAFQLVDDLLDATSNQNKLGKPTGLDAKNNKKTLLDVLGKEKLQERVSHLVDQAKSYIQDYGDRAEVLFKLADFVLSRSY